MIKFNLMGLELGGQLPGHFAVNIPGHVYIYFWQNVHSRCIHILLVLFVPSERVPASACAERLLCVCERIAKLERPPGITTPV